MQNDAILGGGKEGKAGCFHSDLGLPHHSILHSWTAHWMTYIQSEVVTNIVTTLCYLSVFEMKHLLSSMTKRFLFFSFIKCSLELKKSTIILYLVAFIKSNSHWTVISLLCWLLTKSISTHNVPLRTHIIWISVLIRYCINTLLQFHIFSIFFINIG